MSNTLFSDTLIVYLVGIFAIGIAVCIGLLRKNKKKLAASHIYQYTLDANVTELKCLANVEVDVVEFEAKANSKMTKGKVRDLHLPRELNLGGYVRDKKGYIVTGDTEIKEGDHVIVFCYSSKTRQIEKYFN